ncbi:MAG: two-component regulator propeller domain-containing protein [Bacteroidales bacterium]
MLTLRSGIVLKDWFFISIILLSSTSRELYSQFPSNISSTYTVDHGLAQSTVNCMLRDSRGFLWVGTCGGLSRFDGRGFLNFNDHPDSRNRVSDNFIRWLFEDDSANIWIGTQRGLDCWKPSDQTVKSFIHPHDSLTDTWFIPFYSGKGKLLFAHDQGISGLDVQSGDIIPLVQSEKFAGITNLCCRDQSGFWFVVVGLPALVHYNMSDHSTEFFSLPGSVHEVNEMLCSDEGELYLATDQGLISFSTGNRKFHTQLLEGFPLNVPVTGACRDPRGFYWFALGNNWLLHCDASLHPVRISGSEQWKMKSTVPLRRLLPDREGNLWAGTDGYGLFKINPSLSRFPIFRFPESLPKGSNFIRCFTTQNGKLFVGTFGSGLFTCDPGSNKFDRVIFPGKSLAEQPSVTCLLPVEPGWVLAGTPEGLALADPLSHKIKWILHINPLPSHTNYVRALCAVKENLFMAAGHGFICLFSIKPNGDIDILERQYGPYRINSLYADRTGKILAGTSDKGFEVIDVDSSSIRRRTHYPGSGRYEHALFRTFFRDAQMKLWAGTDLGLMQLSDSLKFLGLLSENEGLADNDVYGILEDQHQRLWLSTNKGISCFTPANRSFSNYGTKDGLQSAEFNSGAYYKDSDGLMYFGGINGFNYFVPDSIQSNPRRPKPVLISVFIPGEKPGEFILPGSNELDLRFYQNYLAVETAALEFTSPGENEYAFLLEGQDQSWIYTGTNNFIRYNQLQPGNYSLWGMASNNDKQWSDPVKLLSIRLRPPLWKTTWFRILISVIVLGLITYILRMLLTRRMRKKLEDLKRSREIDVLRARISRDLHDSAGAALTRISLMGELARRDLTKNVDITQRLESITSTSRSLIDNFDEIIWATNPEHDNLESLIAYTRTFLSEFLSDLPLEVRVVIQENLPPVKLKPDSRHHLFLIIKECINNTAKHSGATILRLSLQIKDGLLVVEIHDNGKGFNQEKTREFGQGINSMKKRAAEIGACFSIVSDAGMGTRIALSYPLD